MKRKLTAIILLSALIFCSACGSSPEDSTSGSSETTAAQTTAGTLSDNPVSSDTSEIQSAESITSDSTETSAEDTKSEDESQSSESTEETTSFEETDPPAPYAFEFDPYNISSEYAELYGDGFTEVYRGLADAFINYETSCYCPDEATFTVLLGCIDSCMPYFSSDAVLTYDSFDADTQTLTIHYLSTSKEAHDAAYQNFISAVHSYVDGSLFEGDSQLEMAISLYRSFSSALTYDLGASDVSPYSALVNRSGIAHGFAGAYAYLLRQVGIEANTCGGLSYDGSAAHEWVVFRLGESWFYADPTYENGETGGMGLSYFGTNNAERKEAGYDPTYFGVGTTNEFWAYSLGADGAEFDIFRGSTSFELDREASALTLDGGSTVSLTSLPGGAK